MEDYSFYADIPKGYILKVIIDSLTGPIQRGTLTVDKTGISIRQSDKNEFILYDIVLIRKNFRQFKCKKPITISVNLKHMQAFLKNVKKKDSIAMFIDHKCDPPKFKITIRPEGSRKNSRSETNGVSYQEEKNYEMMKLPEGGYKYPMVIDSSDFQKVKRLTTIGKTVDIMIQKDNYICFCSDTTIYDSKLEFGELNFGSGECKVCDSSFEECQCLCDVCGEWLCDCTCVCNECNQWKIECQCISDSRLQESGVFKSQYHSAVLNKLVKFPGLCNQMQFYAPTEPGFPLKIEMNASQGNYTLGTIQIYVKDVEQITLENINKEESDTPTFVTEKKYKGRRK